MHALAYDPVFCGIGGKIVNRQATPQDAAQALSWGLERGVIDVSVAVAWADTRIIADKQNPMWLLELSLVQGDRNIAISYLNEGSEGSDFDSALGLFSVVVNDAVIKSTLSCHTLLRSFIGVVYQRYAWGDSSEQLDEVFWAEEELEDGYGTEEQARAALARYAEPHLVDAVRLGILAS